MRSLLTPDLFFVPQNIIRMGVPPMRIEILTSISEGELEACYAARETAQIEDISVPAISLSRLRENKAASARAQDIADLAYLASYFPT